MKSLKLFQARETERLQQLNGEELASFVQRLFAFLIDLMCGSALFVLVAGPFQSLLLTLGIVHEEKELILAFGANWYSIVWFVLYFGIALYFGKGKSPGKWLMRIRVVSLVHPHLSLWHSVERALGYGASLLEGGFGFFQYFLHPNCRTVHDRIAETIVIRDPKTTARESLRKMISGKRNVKNMN
jgi:uncharacterized RDD family membrane protein YckC